ncbi:uncharacterized protein [Dysidea avara]|uniref:uncharacterized protein isoform X2 n=1 Tax=Dysidea avara TaxID=196820 RepID=UPI00332DF8CB
MSLSDAEKGEGSLVEKQRWFFSLISASQAETILSQESTGGRISRFVVSNIPPSKDYRLSVRRAGRKSLPNDVEHITISYNAEDQTYGIDEQNRYQSVVEVVRNYVVSQDFPLKPLSGSLEISSESSGTRPMLMSLTSIESSQMEEPPAYTTAVQYPTDKRPLPQIKTRLDPNKAQEAMEYSFGESYFSEEDPNDRRRRPRPFKWNWATVCIAIVYIGCESGENWYSIRDAGWLRQCCWFIILLLIIMLFGTVCGTFVTCGYICYKCVTCDWCYYSDESACVLYDLDEAKLEGSFRDSSTSGGGGGGGRNMFQWNHRHRRCCFLNCDSAWDKGDEFYSIRGAGWLRQICLIFLLLFFIGVCGCWCGCCITCCYLCAKSSKFLPYCDCDEDWDCCEDSVCCSCCGCDECWDED